MTSYRVHADWDDEARVWVATSDDVSGLRTEADTVEALIAKLRVMVPELLEANEVLPAPVGEVPIELVALLPRGLIRDFGPKLRDRRSSGRWLSSGWSSGRTRSGVWSSVG